MWYYLRALWVQDGVTQSELSAQIGTMEPTTLSAVAAMEQAGFVRRERHSTDRRKFQVFLTPAGQALRATLLPEAIDVIRVATGRLSAREVDAFLGTLKTIQQNLGGGGEAPKPRKPSPGA
jgi:MarR family transcriptional regulator, organic hydroperoxide resistance regulator